MGALGEQWFAASGAYEINYSCRFNDGDSPELSRTYTLNAPWTFSAWVKRGELGSENMLLGASGGEIHFNSNDTLESEGTSSTAVFRDPAAWYHIHVSNNGQFVNGVSHGAVTTTNLSNTKLFDDFDGYVAEPRASEWDIAAGHAILFHSGGSITDFNNNEILYGKKDFKNPSLILKRKNLI